MATIGFNSWTSVFAEVANNLFDHRGYEAFKSKEESMGTIATSITVQGLALVGAHSSGKPKKYNSSFNLSDKPTVKEIMPALVKVNGEEIKKKVAENLKDSPWGDFTYTMPSELPQQLGASWAVPSQPLLIQTNGLNQQLMMAQSTNGNIGFLGGANSLPNQ